MEIFSSIRALVSDKSESPSFVPEETRDTMLLNARQGFSLMMGGEPTAAGEEINENSALKIGWVADCIRVIAETACSLPVRVYEQTKDGQREATEHSLSYLFETEPNPEMTGPVMIETLVGSIAASGNGYLEIIRDKRGNVLQLYPRDSREMHPQRSESKQLEYLCTEGGEKRIIRALDMIHVPLWSWNGLHGLSPVTNHAQSLGFAQATLKQGARFIGNGFSPKGIITPDGTLNKEQAAQVISMLEQQASGINQGRVAVLPASMKYLQLGLSMADATFLESRAFSRNEVASMFRLDPHYLGDTTRQSNTNAEQTTLNLLQETMQPYLTKIRAELNRKLLPMTARKRSSYVIRFDLTERLKADLKTTLETLALSRQWSIMTIDEARKHLGLNPIGGNLGNSLMSPTNMMDANKWLEWSPQQKSDTSRN